MQERTGCKSRRAGRKMKKLNFSVVCGDSKHIRIIESAEVVLKISFIVFCGHGRQFSSVAEQISEP